MEIYPKPIEDRALLHAQGRYLDTLMIWCQIKYPFAGDKAYQLLRGHVLRYARYKEQNNQVVAAIRTIDTKRQSLEEDLQLNADKYLFYGEYIETSYHWTCPKCGREEERK
jgi:hypothetical protein